jgi:hypothetical protein
MNSVVVTCKSCGKKVRVWYTTGDPDYYVPIECPCCKQALELSLDGPYDHADCEG